MLPDDPDGLADLVVQTIDTALGPVLERLAGLDARLSVLGDLRDRVVTIETKALQTLPPDPLLGGRIDAMEARLAPVLERVAATEVRLALTLSDGQALGALRDRVLVVETKAALPAPVAPEPTDDPLLDLRARVAALELHVQSDTATKDLGALRERIAVVEVRQPVPGPAGKDGADGLHGKDGADGLGFGDLSLVQEDERTLIVRASRDGQTKDVGTLTLPVELYRGVYLEGKTYQRGDCVTWAGSEWHGNETTTTKPGEGSKAWTLKVKRGRDGKDGRDAPGALPVVSVGGGR